MATEYKLESKEETNTTRRRLNKQTAPLIAILLAALLAISKAITGFFSGSLAVLSSAMDSMFDVLASSINYVMIKKADVPPDEDHNFGHGKFESYASFLQSILIFGTGLYLMYEAFNRLKSGAVPTITNIVFIVMLASIVVSFVITFMLRFTGKREKSMALRADAEHYAMDIASNSGVLIAVLVVKITGLAWIDAALGILIACYIMYSALKIHIEALKVILDANIPQYQLKVITDVLEKYAPYIKNYHRLRARTDGNRVFADVHLLLSSDLTLGEAHALCDLIESEMPENIDLMIHPESSDIECVDKTCSRESVLQLLDAKGIKI